MDDLFPSAELYEQKRDNFRWMARRWKEISALPSPLPLTRLDTWKLKCAETMLGERGFSSVFLHEENREVLGDLQVFLRGKGFLVTSKDGFAMMKRPRLPGELPISKIVVWNTPEEHERILRREEKWEEERKEEQKKREEEWAPIQAEIDKEQEIIARRLATLRPREKK